MTWLGWMRMIGPRGSPSALAASSSASASPRTMTQRGRQGGRTVYATLTTEGEKAFAAAQPAFADAVQRHFAGQMNQAEIRQLLHLSERILQQPPNGY